MGRMSSRSGRIMNERRLPSVVAVLVTTLPGSQEIGPAGTAGSITSHVANVNVGRSNRLNQNDICWSRGATRCSLRSLGRQCRDHLVVVRIILIDSITGTPNVVCQCSDANPTWTQIRFTVVPRIIELHIDVCAVHAWVVRNNHHDGPDAFIRAMRRRNNTIDSSTFSLIRDDACDTAQIWASATITRHAREQRDHDRRKRENGFERTTHKHLPHTHFRGSPCTTR